MTPLSPSIRRTSACGISIGETAILPLVGRRIPIVADEYADPEKGTGAVKITPAHDFNDFEVGRRHDLPLVNVLDVEGRLDLTDNAAFLDGVPVSAALEETLALHGLDRFVARKKIVERLEALGLLDKIEPNTHIVPHGDRSGAVIEPYLTDQWYVDAKTLAQPAIDAVRAGRTVFVPEQWQATFFDWMENIQPWCISRQIWWGHRIPAWYGPDGKVFVAENEDDAVADALAHYTEIEEITAQEGHDIAADPARQAWFANEYLHRDEDVLDTWFSSALWPFSTLGWPDETVGAEALLPDQRARHRLRHHLLLGRAHDDDGAALHEGSAVPRPSTSTLSCATSAAQKMSKSKGNVIDPLQVIDEYGADALRFTLGGDGGAGPRHQAFCAARRGLSQFRDQALECRAFRRDQRLRAQSRFRSAPRRRSAQPLDRSRDGADCDATSPRRSKPIKFNEAAERRLSLRLECLLRLVS